MPRFTNQPQDQTLDPTDTGAGAQGTTTANQDVTNLGLTETTVDPNSQQQQVIIPKTTIYSGTDYKFPARQIAMNSADWAKIANDQVIDTSLIGKSTVRAAGRRGPNMPYIYTGPQLIDETGHIAGQGYSANGSDISAEFFGVKTSAERATMIATATKLGLFFSSKPSGAMISGSGLSNSDSAAIQGLLDYSNGIGRTWRATAELVSSGMITAAGGGGGSSYSVVSTEDAMAAAKDAWFSVLKRPPTADEMKQAAVTIQQNERARAQGKNMDPTSLKTAAVQQAQQTSPGEYAATSAGNALTRMFSLFGGR
jgi:hypothetical protein